MKLYATVTSERASKSQGGNTFASVEFTKDRELIAKVLLDAHGFLYVIDGKGNRWVYTRAPYTKDELELLQPIPKQENGKKQKGDKPHIGHEHLLKDGECPIR